MKNIITICLLLATTFSVSAQKDVKLTLNHLLDTEDFGFNQTSQNDMGQDFKLTRFEYYISEISITHDGGTITEASDIYILVRANKTDTITLGNFDITNIEAISFSVGVGPSVNNEDPSTWGALHALSPKSPSMHWGWAAGYRFAAIEGESAAGLEFQIHALGNKNFFKQSIPTSAVDVSGSLVITLKADYTKSLSQIVVNDGLIEHGGNNEAATCLRNFQTKVFTSLTGEGNTLSAKNLKIIDAFTISPVPSNRNVIVQLNDHRFLNGSMIVTDITGKEILSQEIGLSNHINIDTKGLYFISLSGKGIKSSKKLIIQ
ncbi:MAG: hypothetical protein COA58_12495 [Bacteroidetes bacterium]|nr:MAG: hypothetical protein COA58_12495 [Bacteroidota bacterium]